MSYTLKSFAGVSLKRYEESENIGSGAAPGNYLMTAAGLVDGFGTLPSYVGGVSREKSFKLAEASKVDLMAEVYALRELIGQRGTLTREDSNGNETTTIGRLVNVDIVTTTEESRGVLSFGQSVGLVFECETPWWLGAAGSKTFGYNNGTNTSTLTTTDDDGRIPIRACLIRSTPSGPPVPAIKVLHNDTGQELDFSATAVPIYYMVADGGARTVRDYHVSTDALIADVYDRMTITARSEDYPESWLTLLPGDNSISVTCLTNFGNLKIEWFEWWL